VTRCKRVLETTRPLDRLVTLTSGSDLNQCVEGFHDVSLEQVLGEIKYLRDEGDTVLAGGSLVYGVGNHLSDLDLLVTGPTTLESSRVPIEHFIGSLRVDVWKLAQGLIEDSFDRAQRALAAEDTLLGSFGDTENDDELKLLHRIAFGVVIDGDGIHTRPKRDYRAVAAGLVVREYLERMRTSALLAQLALGAKRSVAAVVNARLAVEDALNAAVAHRRLPFSGGKWLGERLASQTSDLAHVYEPFRQLPKAPREEATQFVEKALATCVEMWALDLGLEALTPVAKWVNADLQVAEIGGDQLLLSPRFGALWTLDEKEVAIWRQLVSSVVENRELCVYDAEGLSMCLCLHEQGLLDLQWIKGVVIENPRSSRNAGVVT
jgi:hypothetical protein